ncbi:MAG: HAD family hydrolase [Campylobacteraceae bacterium]
MQINIPNYKNLEIKNLVFDFNGTLAKDGKLLEGVAILLEELSRSFDIFVLTADTNKSVENELKGLHVKTVILKSKNHTNEKMEFVQSLGYETCASFGNGANDELMLKHSCLSIVVLGDEGCATKTLLASTLTCKSIFEAIELFLYPNRLIASLRA